MAQTKKIKMAKSLKTNRYSQTHTDSQISKSLGWIKSDLSNHLSIINHNNTSPPVPPKLLAPLTLDATFATVAGGHLRWSLHKFQHLLPPQSWASISKWQPSLDKADKNSNTPHTLLISNDTSSKSIFLDNIWNCVFFYGPKSRWTKKNTMEIADSVPSTTLCQHIASPWPALQSQNPRTAFRRRCRSLAPRRWWRPIGAPELKTIRSVDRCRSCLIPFWLTRSLNLQCISHAKKKTLR